TIPADLCEEIARMLGYDDVPSTLPFGRQSEPSINEDWRRKEWLRQVLAGIGVNEVVTYSLTSRERLGRLNARSGLVAATNHSGSVPTAASGSRPVDLGQAVS